MNGIAKWLKDKEDNILIPHTLTSAVFNSEGKNLDELLANSSSSIIIDSELSKESENPVQNKVITEKLEEVFQSVSDGKSKLAAAITGLGVETAADATFEEIVENINSIVFPNSMNFISSDDAITGIAEYTTAYGFIPPNEAIVGTTAYSVETIVINDTIYGLANYL